MKRIIAANVIYSIPVVPMPESYVVHALKSYREISARRIVVCTADYVERARALVADRPQDVVLEMDPAALGVAGGYRQGLNWLWEEDTLKGQVILSSTHVIGPLLPIDKRAHDLSAKGAGLYSAYWHDDPGAGAGQNAKDAEHAPSLDFAILSEALVKDPGFRALWSEIKLGQGGLTEVDPLGQKIGACLKAAGLDVIYPESSPMPETPDPRHSEIDKLVAAGTACVPVSVLRMDPLLHDLKAVNLRRALDRLRQSHNEVYRQIVSYCARHVPPRDFAMVADQYEVLSLDADNPDKTSWSFGRIAVFIHAYYAEMMPEFGEVLARIPCSYDVFITTSSEADRARIEEFLDSNAIGADARQVVVVEQNRGRDMSSLFITFREVALSGRYKVALRLHSKRTPQVSRQVGEGFKEHLFENLAASRGYIANILDRFEAEPDVGMIMPPVMHIGFGTLGHAWFNNFQMLAEVAEKMGLRVPYDAETPLAPLGTMYWFKPDALYNMFSWPWSWSDYNPEPRHIDGGLAHVQERLLCYACIDRGYRVLMAMTPQQAARNYSKLEYKLQTLASRLASGNVYYQRDQLDQLRFTTRSWTLRKLMALYARIIRAYPSSRRVLRPAGHAVRRILNPRT